MTKEELQILYKEKVLPENKQPYHFEKKESANNVIEAYNPFCGDKFTLYLDDQFEDVHFHGIGCAISKASTSILLKKIEGKTKEEASVLCHRFVEAIDSDQELPEFDDEELEILASLKHFDGRMDCVKLSWKALKEFLSKSK